MMHYIMCIAFMILYVAVVRLLYVCTNAFLQTSTCETPLIANSKYLYCPPLEIFYPTIFARLCDNKTISRHTLFIFFIPLHLKWLNEKN